jgi:hypothetical protein
MPCICFIDDEGQDKHAQSRYLVGPPRSTKNAYVAAAVLCTCNAVYETWLRAKPFLQLNSFSGAEDGGNTLLQSVEKFLPVYIHIVSLP